MLVDFFLAWEMACKRRSLQIYKLGDVDNLFYNDSQFTAVILRDKVVQECTFCTGMRVLSPENNLDIEGWKLSELTPHQTFTLYSTRTAFDSADWQYLIERLFSILKQNKACNLRYNAYLKNGNVGHFALSRRVYSDDSRALIRTRL